MKALASPSGLYRRCISYLGGFAMSSIRGFTNPISFNLYSLRNSCIFFFLVLLSSYFHMSIQIIVKPNIRQNLFALPHMCTCFMPAVP